MWSHYADKHKGICLKYDMYKDEKFFTIPLKVDYPDNYPIFDFLKIRETNQLIQFFLGTKSKDWKYENEIRIIKDKNQFGKFREAINFNKSSLIEVIFGYKTDKSTISNIMTLLKGIGYNCLFSRVDLIENNFGLKKIPM